MEILEKKRIFRKFISPIRTALPLVRLSALPGFLSMNPNTPRPIGAAVLLLPHPLCFLLTLHCRPVSAAPPYHLCSLVIVICKRNLDHLHEIWIENGPKKRLCQIPFCHGRSVSKTQTAL